jgi:hypothetical protein
MLCRIVLSYCLIWSFRPKKRLPHQLGKNIGTTLPTSDQSGGATSHADTVSLPDYRHCTKPQRKGDIAEESASWQTYLIWFIPLRGPWGPMVRRWWGKGRGKFQKP